MPPENEPEKEAVNGPGAARKHGLPRRLFRWFRILVLAVALVLTGLLIYLNQVGLPGALKEVLVAELESQGVNLEFERVRLRWYEGLVAEQVSLTLLRSTNTPSFDVDRLVLGISGDALKQRQLKVTGLQLKDGSAVVPFIPQPGLLRDGITVSNIQANLKLLPDDVWELAPLKGQCAGATVEFTASITNAPALRHMRKPRREEQREPNFIWQFYVERTFDIIEQLETEKPPALYIHLEGDAADTNHIHAALSLDAQGVRTPWGNAGRLHFFLPLEADEKLPGLFNGHLDIELDDFSSPELRARRIDLEANVEHALTNRIPHLVTAQIQLAQAATDYGRLREGSVELRMRCALDGKGVWTSEGKLEARELVSDLFGDAAMGDMRFEARHRLDGSLPEMARLDIALAETKTHWGELENLSLQLSTTEVEEPPVPIEGLPEALQPLLSRKVDCRIRAGEIRTEWLSPEKLELELEWDSPNLRIGRLRTGLFGGDVDLSLGLDTMSREAKTKGLIHFDILKLKPLFGPKTQQWLDRYAFDQAPEVTVHGARAILPEWQRMGEKDVWREDLLPTLELSLGVASGPGAYQGVPFDRASTDIYFTNRYWFLPNLTMERPEGRAVIEHGSDEVTQDYHFKIDSSIDPGIIGPLLSDGAVKVMDEIQFTKPPHVKGTIWGQWRAPEKTGADALVEVTNVTVRGVHWDGVKTRIAYTNQLLVIDEPFVHQKGGTAHGGRMTIETFKGGRMTFSNMVSRIDYFDVTRTIGPLTHGAVEPYVFKEPPHVITNGTLPLNGEPTTDMHFQIIEGHDFEWWKFHADAIRGDVHWVTNQLVLTNMQGLLFDGDFAGSAHFNFDYGKNAAMTFDFASTNADFGLIMTNLFDSTNRMTGIFTGHLNVTNAFTGDMNTWSGYGDVLLEDGFIWDIPLFGGFSKVAEALLPDLGTPRVNRGAATFVLTNGVIHTSDMALHAKNIRLKYDGTVDFDGNLDARMQGDLFRERGAVKQTIGYLMTPFTKLMEFRISGTLAKPEKEPLYFPKIFRETLNPFSWFGRLFDTDKEKKEEDDSRGGSEAQREEQLR